MSDSGDSREIDSYENDDDEFGEKELQEEEEESGESESSESSFANDEMMETLKGNLIYGDAYIFTTHAVFCFIHTKFSEDMHYFIIDILLFCLNLLVVTFHTYTLVQNCRSS